ncbi:tagaturonate reductase [Arachidicoccus soli]|nr:tagaturonate reductase [Arachidicoccus soli]
MNNKMQQNETDLLPLSRKNLIYINNLPVPSSLILNLPEKVLQFGTGVLLRGLPDDYIDHANKQGIFNGRIVIVKSTQQNKVDDFDRQDGLYTLCKRGWEKGEMISENSLNASVSRVLSADDQWNEVMKCAHNPELAVIVSNTTEVGIVLDAHDKISTTSVPHSFPGKLVAFLLERYKAFKGEESAGMVIIPTELIANNGKQLKNICIELAEMNKLESGFISWLKEANDFCDSLVDRIVAGKVKGEEGDAIQGKLGYKDNLMIMSEVYGLWAIQASKPHTKKVLSFAKANSGVVVQNDIERFRRMKLFLLNAPHTFTVVIAMACGFKTVKEAMDDKAFESFITDLIFDEIIKVVVNDDISKKDAELFAAKVLDRFRNPFIQHYWIDISKQISSKILMRCIPLIKGCQDKFEALPQKMIQGLAAYLLYTKTAIDKEGNYMADLNKKEIILVDAKAELLYKHWQAASMKQAVSYILSDKKLWNENLKEINGLEQAVLKEMNALLKNNDFLKE